MDLSQRNEHSDRLSEMHPSGGGSDGFQRLAEVVGHISLFDFAPANTNTRLERNHTTEALEELREMRPKSCLASAPGLV